MFSAKQIAKQQSTSYATGADFCRIFEKDMDRLYLLSYLLTADYAMAEACLVRALEDSAKSNRVFKEWAGCWARRNVIQNAVQMIGPLLTDSSMSSSKSDRSTRQAMNGPEELGAIVDLPTFERFVFVISVLEGYSVQDSSLLLGCTREQLIASRARALQQIGRSAELRGKPVSSGRNEPVLRKDRGSTLQLEAIPHLTASA